MVIYSLSHNHQRLHMWRIPPEMRHWYQHIHSFITSKHYSLNNPSQSLPRNRAGRLFRAGRPFHASAQQRNTQRDSEVPRSASLGPRETPYDTPGLPCSMLLIWLLSYPERAGIPNASLRRFDDRPDFSDLDKSSLWESTAWLGGLSDRPVILQTIHYWIHIGLLTR